MTDPNERSVGDVKAPVETKCCRCSVKLIRSSRGDSWICDECFEILQNEGEPALATHLERAAVVKYLYKRADDIADPFWRSMVQNWVLVIEKGQHVP